MSANQADRLMTERTFAVQHCYATLTRKNNTFLTGQCDLSLWCSGPGNTRSRAGCWNDLLVLPGVKQGVWKERRTGAKNPKESKNYKKSAALPCSCGSRRCDRWRSYTNAGDVTELPQAAVSDAACETAIEGGLRSVSVLMKQEGQLQMLKWAEQKGLKQGKGWTWG